MQFRKTDGDCINIKKVNLICHLIGEPRAAICFIGCYFQIKKKKAGMAQNRYSFSS